jgi:light-regulated signal transduction histidine kinase (bacteriophytochrome)
MEEELQAQHDELVIKNAELEAYDHTIAHGLKTPRSASIHFLVILANFKSNNLSEEQFQLANQAYTAPDNTNAIVGALLMLSTVSNQQVALKPLDMKRLANEALRQLQKERRRAQATVEMPRKWLLSTGFTPWDRFFFTLPAIPDKFSWDGEKGWAQKGGSRSKRAKI